jgi:hypothetical protein
MTIKEEVAALLPSLESPDARLALERSLAAYDLIPVTEAVAGGAADRLARRIQQSPDWNDQYARKAMAQFLDTLRRDVAISMAASVIFLLGIIATTVVIFYILMRVVQGEFSAKHLAGVPLPFITKALFSAFNRERKKFDDVRRDLMRANGTASRTRIARREVHQRA